MKTMAVQAAPKPLGPAFLYTLREAAENYNGPSIVFLNSVRARKPSPIKLTAFNPFKAHS
jgi:hypothetical protein